MLICADAFLDWGLWWGVGLRGPAAALRVSWDLHLCEIFPSKDPSLYSTYLGLSGVPTYAPAPFPRMPDACRQKVSSQAEVQSQGRQKAGKGTADSVQG